jgi:FkbM family methyltransferase
MAVLRAIKAVYRSLLRKPPRQFAGEAPIDHPDQWFGGRTYAQHGDDLIILNIFKRIGIERPSYVDVGAHHPFNISNTALLYKRGSRGINVEANPNLIGAFQKHRPEDINVNVGVGPQAGTMPFYLHDSTSGLNSFVRSEVEKFGISGEIDVPVLPIQNIIETHAQGRFPDLLSLDVEGLDLAILETIDFAQSAPKVICVEMETQSTSSSGKIKDLLISNGYFPYCWAGVNMMFVKNEYRESLY